jgi:hypothetical protein
MMLENRRALSLENDLADQDSALNIKQDNNSLVCESQDVPYACIIRRIDSIQATLARMVTILNSDPEQKVQP